MGDVFEQDRMRFAGITQGASIIQKVNLDLQVAAARALEAERQADMRAREAALAHEAALIGEAERAAVEKLQALQPLYREREEAARSAIEAVARLAKIETDLRAGLSEADRALQNVEPLIEPSARPGWRSALRERAGLPSRHIFIAPREWLANDAQRTGAVAVAGVTSFIGPGFVRVGSETINFDL